jgi:hypothetical protein
VKPTITEDIDRALQAAYAQGIVPGKTLPALARQFAIPKWRLKRRAMELGISIPRLKTPYWTEAEVEYLHTIAHLNLTVIRKKLIAAGYPVRTVTAINLKIKRSHITREVARADAGWYTATALGALCNKDIKSVTRWIERGWLKACRGQTGRTPQQGGDFWLIHDQDIRRMVIEHAEQMDFGRWDRRFLVDVLTAPNTKTNTITLQRAA